MTQASVSPVVSSSLLVTFFIRGTHCAVDAGRVREVIRLGRVTPVRHAPAEVLGIVNLRGRIVTILDVGLLLGFEKSVAGSDSRVFIIEDAHEYVGFLVDRAGEVVEVDGGRMESAPANVSRAQGRYFRGVHRVRGQVLTEVDVDELRAGSGQ